MLRPKSEEEMQILHKALSSRTGLTPNWTQDEKGNYFGWLRLEEPAQLVRAAVALSKSGARLATITALAENRQNPAQSLVMVYHFSLGGTLFNVEVALYRPAAAPALPEESEAAQTEAATEQAADTAVEVLAVPSISRWFANAAWPERECYEMYKVDISGLELPEKETVTLYAKPKPAKTRRLFLDESLEAGIMTTLIPFSAMVNGATTKDLWERVMNQSGGPDND